MKGKYDYIMNWVTGCIGIKVSDSKVTPYKEIELQLNNGYTVTFTLREPNPHPTNYTYTI